MVWFNVVLKQPDQLRQRVAWALAQVFTLSTPESGRMTEAWLSFYDNFVHNAFGNFRDVIRGVSRHALMGIALTFTNNLPLEVSGTFPDENFAREVMQLFSIGAWALNPDGTVKHDDNGDPINAYDNDNIMDFARVWTGLTQVAERANKESVHGNMIDPMRVVAKNHDAGAKTNLYGGYLGDALPLCVDLPADHFLLEGARYVLRGYNSAQGETADNHARTQALGHFTPSSSSSLLYLKLCQPDENARCTFPGAVTLDHDLVCDGVECEVDEVLSVKVVDGDQEVFYTYEAPPCVFLSAFEGKEKGYAWRSHCANPESATAGVECCAASGTGSGVYE